jgi:PPOX class probable F420-dependent enzyme
MTTVDPNKRRLTRAECEQLLTQPRVGVFSSVTADGWIHSVPVHFLYRDGVVRVLVGSRSVKARNVDRAGRATLCVEVTEGSERRYVMVEGPARVDRPAPAAEVTALDERYGRADTAEWTEADYAGEGMVVLEPTRWIAWADWD